MLQIRSTDYYLTTGATNIWQILEKIRHCLYVTVICQTFCFPFPILSIDRWHSYLVFSKFELLVSVATFSERVPLACNIR